MGTMSCDWHEVAIWLHKDKKWSAQKIADLFGRSLFTVYGVLNGYSKLKNRERNPEKYTAEYYRAAVRRSRMRKLNRK